MERVFIGTMSGTSADGVDVCIVRVLTEISHRSHQLWNRCHVTALLAHETFAYEPTLRARILQVKQSGQPVHLAELCTLGRDISLAHAKAVLSAVASACVRLSSVAAVALHGNTLYHSPPLTLQWADPALVAAETGCTVVADFRRADCAAGGQGAPLVPFADYLLFRPERAWAVGDGGHGPAGQDRDGPGPRLAGRVLLNLGGIANITTIPSASSVDGGTAGRGADDLPAAAPAIVAFDTGPANCITDALVRQFAGILWDAGMDCDPGGAQASAGRVLWPVVESALSAPYFSQAHPKSTDVPQMLAVWQDAGGQDMADRLQQEAGKAAGQPPSPEHLSRGRDLLATACAITARAVQLAIQAAVHATGTQAGAWEVVASGGGVHNACLMDLLRAELGVQAPPPCWGPVEAGACAGAGVGSAVERPLPSVSRVVTSEALGMPSEAKEAVAFALLAAATLDGVPGNVPSCTGASGPVVLGAVYPQPRPGPATVRSAPGSA